MGRIVHKEKSQDCIALFYPPVEGMRTKDFATNCPSCCRLQHSVNETIREVLRDLKDFSDGNDRAKLVQSLKSQGFTSHCKLMWSHVAHADPREPRD